MQKGFGLYSKTETVVFLLKAILLSFWAGMDGIAVLVLATSPAINVWRHGVLWLSVSALLIAGTVYAALFAWMLGSSPGTHVGTTEFSRVAALVDKLKRRRDHLIVAGGVLASVTFAVVVGTGGWLLRMGSTVPEIGRAGLATGRKCAEVASLEKSLFGSDAQFVMSECLIQYDEKYAALRNADRVRKR